MARGSGTALFVEGDAVFVRPIAHSWRQQAFTVIQPLCRRGWPHYRLLGPDGGIWLVSQLELSASPIWSGADGSEARPRRRRSAGPGQPQVVG